MIRIRDFVEFLKKYQNDTLLKDWTEKEILNALRRALHDNALAYSQDENGEFTGICIGYVEDNTVHIVALLLLDETLLKKYFASFVQKFKGYKLRAYRKNKLIVYKSPENILKRL